MKRMELEAIEYESVNRRYYGGWNSNKTQEELAVKQLNIIDEGDLEIYKDYINLLCRNTTKSLNPGEKVYFDSSAVFPRNKFRKTMPDNKIVVKPEKADVIIVDIRTLKSSVSYFPIYTLEKTVKGTYKDFNVSSAVLSGSCNPVVSRKVCLSTWNNTIDKTYERSLVTYKFEGKKIMDIKDLSLPSEERLTPESFEKIGMMLGGTDDTMRNMAVSLLTAYDYEVDKARIALLMHMNWSKWKSSCSKKVNIEMKTLLNKLRLDFPGYDYMHDNNSFWIKLALDNHDDEMIQSAFNLWIKSQYPQAPDIRLQIVKKDE